MYKHQKQKDLSDFGIYIEKTRPQQIMPTDTTILTLEFHSCRSLNKLRYSRGPYNLYRCDNWEGYRLLNQDRNIKDVWENIIKLYYLNWNKYAKDNKLVDFRWYNQNYWISIMLFLLEISIGFTTIRILA
jgi:hypothetical protein